MSEERIGHYILRERLSGIRAHALLSSLNIFGKYHRPDSAVYFETDDGICGVELTRREEGCRIATSVIGLASIIKWDGSGAARTVFTNKEQGRVFETFGTWDATKKVFKGESTTELDGPLRDVACHLFSKAPNTQVPGLMQAVAGIRSEMRRGIPPARPSAAPGSI